MPASVGPRAKQRAGDLARFGGPRAFDEPRYVGRPNIGDRTRFLERVGRILDSKWLTNGGPVVREFESVVAGIVGVEHCVATSNATLALQVALRAGGFEGEIVVPSFTFAATAHAAAWQGMTPVFCDVDPATHCIDPRDAELRITARTSAILAVHLWGHPADVAELERVATRRGVGLLFDAAHAFGSSYRGRMIGSFGRAEVFSFHATKFVSSFEGGVIATNDGALASAARRMINFGFAGEDRDATVVGLNAKMPEICAAMGLTSLESMDAFVEHDRANYDVYREELDGIAGIRMLELERTERNNLQFVVIEVPTGGPLSRDDVLAILRAEGIVAQAYCSPALHEMRVFRDVARASLPVSERLAREVLVLPTGTATSPDDVRAICRVLRYVMENAGEVARRLRTS